MARTTAERNFQQLVDLFTGTKELEYYDTRSNSLFLCYMPNNSTDLMELRRRIRSVTEKFKLVVSHPHEMSSKIQILNVELKPQRNEQRS